MSKKNLGFGIIISGIISGVIFFVAGNSIGSTGQIMTEIQSQAGNTVAEAYYQNVGGLAKGVSMLIYAMGLSVITFSTGFGGKLILQEDIDKKREEQSQRILKLNFKADPNIPISETFEDLPEL